MRTQFPSFDQIALGTDTKGNLHVVGLKRTTASGQESLFLAAWQAWSTEHWMIPSYNQLGFSRRGYLQAELATGLRDPQLVGLTTEGRLYQAAYIDSTGMWRQGRNDPLDNMHELIASFALVMGADDNLQALCLTKGYGGLYLAAWQDKDSGNWHPDGKALVPFPDWQSIAAARGADGNLYIFGLKNDAVYKVAWQDKSGNWLVGDNKPISTNQQYKVLRAGSGSSGLIQVIGGVPYQGGAGYYAYLVASQGGSGSFEPKEERLGLSGQGWAWKTIEVGKGAHASLEVLGIDMDRKLHRIAWQDAGGTWRQGDTNPIGPHRSYSDLQPPLLGSSRIGSLQAIGKGDDGELYVAGWQDSTGVWESGQSLSQTNTNGRWNETRLISVTRAFESVPSVYSSLDLYLASPDIPFYAHYQGMARYGEYYLLTHDRTRPSAYGYVDVLNRIAFPKREVQIFDTPEKDYRHPGGCQIVGDYLGVELELQNTEEDAVVRFYWLGSMTDTTPPTLMPSRFQVPRTVGGASALAITDIGNESDRGYLMALKTGEGITFFRPNNCWLDDPELQFTRIFCIPEKDFPIVDGIKHGPDNINLLAQQDSKKVYLISLGGNQSGLTHVDWADLYEVDLTASPVTWKIFPSKHIVTSGVGLAGVHFRYGAGTWVGDDSSLELFGCSRNAGLHPWGSGTVVVNQFSGRIPLVPSKFPRKTQVAAVLRNSSKRDLFAVDNSGRVSTAWSREIDGPWQGWLPVGEDVFPSGTPVTAISSTPEEIDLFAVDANGRVRTTRRSDNNGTWQEWRTIPSPSVAVDESCPIAAVSRNPGRIDLFLVGRDSKVYTAWRNGPNAEWSSFAKLRSKDYDIELPRAYPLSATSRKPGGIDLLAVGRDGKVWNAWPIDNDTWQGWFKTINERIFEVRTPLTVYSRRPELIGVYGFTSGVVRTESWTDGIGRWQGFGSLPTNVRDFPLFTPIAAASLTGYDQTMFAVANNQRLYKIEWSDSSGKWGDWEELTNDNFRSSAFGALTPIAVICRRSEHIDLFAVDIHGDLRTAFFKKDLGWSGWDTIGS